MVSYGDAGDGRCYLAVVSVGGLSLARANDVGCGVFGKGW